MGIRAIRTAGTVLAILVGVALCSVANAAEADEKFVSHDADVQGVKIHYTTGGHGPAVLLLHGYAETSRMWTPIFPRLVDKFTVIAPDLPGIGDSSQKRVVGHDIGLMVAYAYAAQYPAETEN